MSPHVIVEWSGFCVTWIPPAHCSPVLLHWSSSVDPSLWFNGGNWIRWLLQFLYPEQSLSQAWHRTWRQLHNTGRFKWWSLFIDLWMIVHNSANQYSFHHCSVLVCNHTIQMWFSWYKQLKNSSTHNYRTKTNLSFFSSFFFWSSLLWRCYFLDTSKWLIWSCDACYVNRPYVEFLQKFIHSMLW